MPKIGDPKSVLIAEPNLLIPHKKPIGAVRLRKGIAGFNPDFYALLHQKDLNTLTGGKWGVNLASNPAYSCDHWTQPDASGWGLHPEGLYKDDSGPTLAHNECQLFLTTAETNPMPGNFQYLVAGIVLQFTKLTAGMTWFPIVLVESGTYNTFQITNDTTITVKIGNTSSPITVDAFSDIPINTDLSVVIMYDQTGSTRNSYCWINGKEYSNLGTTKDTNHDNNDGLYAEINARDSGGAGTPDFVIKAIWFQEAKLSLAVARQISMDPYMVLEAT